MSRIAVSVLIVGATQHLPGEQETLTVRITVYARLSIAMLSDSRLDEVLVNKVRFVKTICCRTMVG
jgi:hypothetical protein